MIDCFFASLFVRLENESGSKDVCHFFNERNKTGKIPRNKSMLSSCLNTGMISSLSFLSSQYYYFCFREKIHYIRTEGTHGLEKLSCDADLVILLR